MDKEIVRADEYFSPSKTDLTILLDPLCLDGCIVIFNHKFKELQLNQEVILFSLR